jgi:hypothetical protein
MLHHNVYFTQLSICMRPSSWINSYYSCNTAHASFQQQKVRDEVPRYLLLVGGQWVLVISLQ